MLPEHDAKRVYELYEVLKAHIVVRNVGLRAGR